MGDAIRCANCGGLNPAGAEWCGQCLVRFTRTPPPPPAPSAPPQPVGAEVAPAPPSFRHQRGVFTVAEEGITWRCTKCDNENPLDLPVCGVCGARFAEIVHPPPARIERDPNTVALYSLLFPGAGHWSLGLKGPAVARAILSAWVILVAFYGAIEGSVPMTVIFAFAALGLWAVGAHDSYREAKGEDALVLLKPRVFVFVVVGLLLVMFILLMIVGLRAVRV